MVKQIAVIGQHLEALQKLPALRNGPDHTPPLSITPAIGLQREPAGRLRREQDWWLWGVGAAGLVAGVLLTLFLPRVLPGSIDMAVASTAMNADRWSAGISLMQSGSLGG